MAARGVRTAGGGEAKGGGAMQRRAGDVAVADAASRLGWPRGSASWQSGGPTRCRAWCWRGKTDPPPWLTHRRRFLAAVDLETGVWGKKGKEQAPKEIRGPQLQMYDDFRTDIPKTATGILTRQQHIRFRHIENCASRLLNTQFPAIKLRCRPQVRASRIIDTIGHLPSDF